MPGDGMNPDLVNWIGTDRYNNRLVAFVAGVVLVQEYCIVADIATLRRVYS